MKVMTPSGTPVSDDEIALFDQKKSNNFAHMKSGLEKGRVVN